ncbi:MAG: GIY-YIG nuclease family protein [Desulfitobacteriaceae bacterium]
MGYWVYLARCGDSTVYTGATTDLKRRINEHNEKTHKGTRYTASHQPVALVQAWEVLTWSDALRLEIAIKKCNRAKKERLILNAEEIYLLVKLRKLNFEIKTIAHLLGNGDN